MLNKKGVSLIALIITIIVIIILAAIVLSSGGDTTNKAQLAVFVNNFSQYQDRVVMDSLNLKQTLGVRSENVNDAQLNYMVANGLKNSNYQGVSGMTMPIGYRLPPTIKKIYSINQPITTGDASSAGDMILDFINPKAYAAQPVVYDPEERVVAYVINDGFISGYNAKPNNEDGSAGYEFYGDSNGEEYHFITSNGHCFTIPGFALTQEDGTISFYISNEKGAYYVVSGQSGLDVGATNINGDKVDELQPITKLNFLNVDAGLYGLTADGWSQYGYSTDLDENPDDFIGRHTVIDQNLSGGVPNAC